MSAHININAYVSHYVGCINVKKAQNYLGARGQKNFLKGIGIPSHLGTAF